MNTLLSMPESSRRAQDRSWTGLVLAVLVVLITSLLGPELVQSVAAQTGFQSGLALAPRGVNPALRAAADFNGDNATDWSVVRNPAPTNASTWFWQNPAGFGAHVFGFGNDYLVPIDFDGDGVSDLAVYRPTDPGRFFILNSTTGSLRTETFGVGGDDAAVSGDYDGDAKADPAVYRVAAMPGAQSYFFYKGSFNNPSGNITYIPWGTAGDVPLAGDYDGDAKFDVAIRRDVGGVGVYYIRQSTGGVTAMSWGLWSDVPILGDFDGDGRTDLVVLRFVGGTVHWHVRQSSDGLHRTYVFGSAATDYPAQGDYDGDSKTDIAIYRLNPTPTPCTFWVWRSSDGVVTAFDFGLLGDYPTVSYAFK